MSTHSTPHDTRSAMAYVSQGLAIIEQALTKAQQGGMGTAPAGLDPSEAKIWNEAMASAYQHCLEMCSFQGLDDLVRKAQQVPTVVLSINGGVVHEARATTETRVIVLDEDTEGGDEENIAEIENEERYVHDLSAEVAALDALIAQVDEHNKALDADSAMDGDQASAGAQ